MSSDLESDDEALLIERLRTGCNRAAERLVRDHAGWMLSVARRYVKEDALAEDCVQEAFLSAFSNIDDFEGRSSLKTWLHRITVNAALMKLRSLRRHDSQSIDELLPEFDANDCRIEAPWHHMATPAELLERKDTRALIAAMIGELPDGYRIILLLRDIEGRSTTEVAELLGLSESNVKVRLHRARAALKKLLEPILRREV